MEMKNLSGQSLASILVSVALLISLVIFYNVYTGSPKKENAPPQRTVIVSEQAVVHILYGDEHGGGHIHGAGKPCKSEFPESWNALKVIESIKAVAANDNLKWKKERNGYYVAEGYQDHVKIRVVLGPQKQKVITGYPVNLSRNPCRPTTNDNEARPAAPKGTAGTSASRKNTLRIPSKGNPYPKGSLLWQRYERRRARRN